MRRLLLALVLLAGVSAAPALASDGIGRADGIGSADGFFSRTQPGAPSGGESFSSPAPAPPSDAPPVPVDGGLALLAVAGAGYAAKRLRARRA